MTMKNFRARAVCFLLVTVILLAFMPPRAGVDAQETRPSHEAHEMRGVWITSAYNLDWPSRRDMSGVEIRAEIDAILRRVVELGMNAVFVQVRPTADSLFPSEIFPWSHAFTGVPGQVPDFYAQGGFDPLAYWIERGHALGVEVHAWLNPYRITHRSQNITHVNQLPANHPARLNPSLAISYSGGLFFDPGSPAVRRFIADGVAEILQNYPTIDGIHFDDYFYPSRDFPDSATFARYGGGYTDIHEWRRSNVNALIQLVQATVRENSPTARWGVSPTAIWMNEQNDPRGSRTRGSESYHRAYADTRRWVLEGWIDYIVPQIYWVQGFDIACYNAVLEWWESVVRGTDVSLYVGMAPYREYLRDRETRFNNWTAGETIRQLHRNSASDVVNGAIFFRYNFLRSEIGDSIAAFYYDIFAGDTPVFAPDPTPEPTPRPRIMSHLSVAQPRANRNITDASNFNFFGTAVPDLPLYVNGIEITNRTEEGFWSIFLPLSRGENEFVFTQPGQPDVVRVITNDRATPAPRPLMDAPALTNVFPAADEYAQGGTTVTLHVTAPAGAIVTANIAGQTVNLTQGNAWASTDTRIYAAPFSATFTLPATPSNDIVDMGRVTYTADFRGQTLTATSEGHITRIGTNAPFYGEISAPASWAFPRATTSGGSSWKFVQGQVDRVTTVAGGWTHFASGMWTESENVRHFTASQYDLNSWFPPLVLQRGVLGEGRYFIGKNEDRIIWRATEFPIVNAEFDGRMLIVSLGMQTATPPVFMPIGNTLMERIRFGTHNGAPAYFLTVREGESLEGFYVEFVDGELHLVLRRRRALTTGNFPFEGFTFVLDAGHGGSDPGAVGPIGGDYAEKHIVMDVTWKLAERLENLGARLHLVRDGDYDVPLLTRADLSREVKPDMFISVHSNSTSETVNATHIHGFTMWYRNPNSRPAAQTFFDMLRYINPLTNRARSINQANFFVCRPVWTPSILVELSFTNNIEDFAWMVCPDAQIDMAWGIVNALLVYYR